MPPGHISRQADYACQAINSAAVFWDNMPMRKPAHFLKEWRKHRDYTQEQMAERLEITQGHLSKIESGKRDYDQALLEKAAEILQCDVPDLLARNPDDPEGMWSIWENVGPVERRQIVEIAKTFKRAG